MALATRTSIASSKVATTRGFLGTRLTAPKAAANGCKYSMKAGNWLPGSETPAWLPDNLPGNYGFDPLSLAKEPESLKRFQESELQHARWAMLGAAGCLGVELLGQGNWYDAPLWAVNNTAPTYLGVNLPFDINTITGVEFVAMAAAESRRNDEKDFTKRCYPGGAFDPMGLSKDPKNLESLKLKEIKNGRLAMVAMIGFIGQHAATGKSPLAALGEHLSSPWAANFATNGVSVPGL